MPPAVGFEIVYETEGHSVSSVSGTTQFPVRIAPTTVACTSQVPAWNQRTLNVKSLSVTLCGAGHSTQVSGLRWVASVMNGSLRKPSDFAGSNGPVASTHAPLVTAAGAGGPAGSVWVAGAPAA